MDGELWRQDALREDAGDGGAAALTEELPTSRSGERDIEL
jgi:hypothetical protein